jgi:hypothetical protein
MEKDDEGLINSFQLDQPLPLRRRLPRRLLDFTGPGVKPYLEDLATVPAHHDDYVLESLLVRYSQVSGMFVEAGHPFFLSARL